MDKTLMTEWCATLESRSRTGFAPFDVSISTLSKYIYSLGSVFDPGGDMSILVR